LDFTFTMRLDAGDKRVLAGRLAGFAVHAPEYFRTGNRQRMKPHGHLARRQSPSRSSFGAACVCVYIAVASGLLRFVGRVLLARARKGIFFQLLPCRNVATVKQFKCRIWLFLGKLKLTSKKERKVN
jgi:hypothetical protein